MKYEYLLFNLIVLASPVLAVAFYRKIIVPKFKSAFVSIFLSAIAFILWDSLAVEYFWEFNNKFILGPKLMKLPVEEILFFFTVPLACLILWVNIKKRFTCEVTKSYLLNWFVPISLVLASIMLYLGKSYTTGVLVTLCAVIILGRFVSGESLQSGCYKIYLTFVLTLTLVFNWYLTQRPVVIYNDLYNTGIRIATIPVEDFLFGVSLLTLTVVLYDYFQKRWY